MPSPDITGLFSFVWIAAIASVAIGQDPRVEPAAGDDPFVVVLGTAQDAGYPQAGCWKACCRPAWNTPQRRRFPSSIAVVDPATGLRLLFDCSWQLPDQLHLLRQHQRRDDSPGLDAVFLTHGHIGHYTGLMHFGREVMGARRIPVYAMPRMREFLRTNGPWSQLVELEQIDVRPLLADGEVEVSSRISVTPIEVPHRGEFSETVGFMIHLLPDSPASRSILYLPDIDKWSRWERKIETVIADVDIAFLDATFYENGEIPGRDMSEIPHPFIAETLLRFQGLPESERNKIQLIHLNHTNPALDPESPAAGVIRRAGMKLAEQGQRY